MRYVMTLLAGLALYTLLLVGTQALLATDAWTGPLRVPIALLPMLGVAVICVAVLRAIRRLDEMQRRMQVEALALACVGTAFLTFGYGFLESVGLPRISAFAVLPLICGLWVVGLVIGRLRLR